MLKRRLDILGAMTKKDVAKIVFDASLANLEKIEKQLELLREAPNGDPPTLRNILEEAGIINPKSDPSAEASAQAGIRNPKSNNVIDAENLIFEDARDLIEKRSVEAADEE